MTPRTHPSSGPGTPAVGVDIGKNSWVACCLGTVLQWVHEYRTLDELVRDLPDTAVVGIDVPVLLEEGWRACDEEGKRLLGSRHSTLFLTPPRIVLEASGLQEANERARSLTGKGLSAQAFALKNRIVEAQRLAEGRPVFEVHPELSFATMAGEPLVEPKTTWNGQMRRRRLLSHEGVEIADRLVRVRRSAPDDVLDAVAVAWSARRIAAGQAERIPTSGGGAAIWR